MEKILSGKPVAILLNRCTKRLISEHNLQPRMCLIQVGSDPASSYYVQSIISSGAKLGCLCELITLSAKTSQAELIAHIKDANDNPEVHGIMIQKPLPRHIADNAINFAISPDKDLDSLHPINLGKIMMEADGFLPCTPAAVFYTMRYYGIDPCGQNLVILGRSNVVGKPLANILLWKKAFANATVTICHSKTKDLAKITQSADILIAAIGKPNFVKPDMIKENCILLDVGINELTNSEGKSQYVGDIDYSSCIDKALATTPVPGGIGRITTNVLYLNLVKACLEQQGINKSVDEYIALIFSANHIEE
ncbi:MAG: bifunctional 5,10-methylenetetrahydrofolate dehydrogenase/5,10-methenyltetrahydrofolate cyclohydrolase [Candidatus Cloacimonas sp.]|jgi:methylenetetrahydrofolate dehydrogenase (NADP+)/methenyltetrahydrofolate cyclohydrolase|nr:bifunctional 5,10-methylenetetrahydrofolate dehydrogenase/5,10-methenyltetrahydrofolate cyclohydrolase [Candidatus Cloacimonas sp.]